MRSRAITNKVHKTYVKRDLQLYMDAFGAEELQAETVCPLINRQKAPIYNLKLIIHV